MERAVNKEELKSIATNAAPAGRSVTPAYFPFLTLDDLEFGRRVVMRAADVILYHAHNTRDWQPGPGKREGDVTPQQLPVRDRDLVDALRLVSAMLFGAQFVRSADSEEEALIANDAFRRAIDAIRQGKGCGPKPAAVFSLDNLPSGWRAEAEPLIRPPRASGTDLG
ncbi:hypothetical protein WK76_24865 [Burkholderia ubonensis]|uniref:hypothetical protein n=1 Tax=Burkholderia ubonensis TaxID=101571 RepID=UPI000758AD02|nr:hypothetical protein [Burkholderia ubonensis]KVU84264.1 hypothetical protein WK76_24865 [Burkholderia ubonensis]